ncbi:hypothetical protein EAO72_00860 [Streptomyces sp. or43]|nr:hypothetical protein EAO72_00860 [Streptomyces sp. or43]
MSRREIWSVGRHARAFTGVRRQDVADCADFGFLTRNYDHLFGEGGGRVGYRSLILRRYV